MVVKTAVLFKILAAILFNVYYDNLHGGSSLTAVLTLWHAKLRQFWKCHFGL